VDPAAEPSLRAYLLEAWRAQPAVVRWAVAGALVALALWLLVGRFAGGADGLDEEALQAQAALARAEFAAMRRMAPDPLGRGVPVTGVLEPGDAERTDDRYVDFYAYETADSAQFSVLVTSADLAPDLEVRTPAGQTIAASHLLRTGTRAEIEGLRGPGRFEVAVTSRDQSATGVYQVEVLPMAPADSIYVDDPTRGDTLRAGARRADRFERIYGIVAGPDNPVVVSVVSEAFMPRVHLLGPNGEVEGAWRTLERSTTGDRIHGVLLRYLPGWEAPYRLIVSSEEPGRSGPFALDVRSIQTRELRSDGRALTSRLGDGSWLVDGRYVDSYRFRVADGTRTIIEARSDEVPPAVRLWHVERRERRDITEVENLAGGPTARIERELDAGEYFIEVTSGGEVEDSTRAVGGEYSLVLRSESVAPPPPRAPQAPSGGAAPSSRAFVAGVSRTGSSGGSTFEVGATQVTISYPRGRTRVQVSFFVRSVDYTGAWAPWRSFAGKAYLVDETGRRYSPSSGESASASGAQAEPGTVRTGTVVFYADGIVANPQRFVAVASIGDGSVTLPITVP
jgi:hypothetical protein